MRTTLSLDPALLAAARSESARTGKSIGDVISEWARRGLQALRPTRGDGVPAFDVPADAEPISGEAVRELLGDEGLPRRR